METSPLPQTRDIPQATLDRRETLNLLLPYRDRISSWQVEAARLGAISEYRQLSSSQISQLDALMREIENGHRQLRTELQNEARSIRQSSLVRDALKAIDSARIAAHRVTRPQ